MMSHVRALGTVGLIALVLFVCGCGRQTTPAGGKMVVAASIAPMADFARQVGGNLVEVELLVPPNANPHVYQLEPEQMKILSKASVLVLNGIHLEYWADKAIGAADNPKMIVVETARGIPVMDHGDSDHPGGNPHVWLDPLNAIRQVKAIRGAFIKADPEHKAAYAANADRYIGQLSALDRDIRSEVKGFRTKEFVTFHPTWVYFAKEYGLIQAAVIEKRPGQEPSPSELRGVIEATKRTHSRAVFAEPQFPPKAAEVVADEAGAKVVFLDAFGKPPAYHYIKTMRENVAKMAKALK